MLSWWSLDNLGWVGDEVGRSRALGMEMALEIPEKRTKGRAFVDPWEGQDDLIRELMRIKDLVSIY